VFKKVVVELDFAFKVVSNIGHRSITGGSNHAVLGLSVIPADIAMNLRRWFCVGSVEVYQTSLLKITLGLFRLLTVSRGLV